MVSLTRLLAGMCEGNIRSAALSLLAHCTLVLVAGTVDGSSQGNELGGLMLVQLDSVEAMRVFGRDELRGVVTGTESTNNISAAAANGQS